MVLFLGFLLEFVGVVLFLFFAAVVSERVLRCVGPCEDVLGLVGGSLVGCLAGGLLSLSSSWSECGAFIVGCGLLLSGGGFVFVCELLSSSLVGDGILATLSAFGLIVGTCDGFVVLMYVMSASFLVLLFWLFLLLFPIDAVLFCGGGL